MKNRKDILFSPLRLPNLVLPNRFIRSATYEGWGNADGMPQIDLSGLYLNLARGGVGTLITGFSFISKNGRAMHPGQCGMHSDEMIVPWQKITGHVLSSVPEVKLIMQLAHAGRQTISKATESIPHGVSSRKCTYFRETVEVLDDTTIRAIVTEFADAAWRAKTAGFHGVQIHAAHGYLVHQFLSPWTNTRTDRWAEPTLFLTEVIHAIRRKCGQRCPILVKLSVADDNLPGVRLNDTARTVRLLEQLQIDAVEISYGTMEYAMNIFRGDFPVDLAMELNPLLNRVPRLLRKCWQDWVLHRYLKKIIPFTPNYNVMQAARIKTQTQLPVFAVGGIRSLENMVNCVTLHGLDAVGLCRPLICEPDLPSKLQNGSSDCSQCLNCNLCTIHCDSQEPLKCYQKGKHK